MASRNTSLIEVLYKKNVYENFQQFARDRIAYQRTLSGVQDSWDFRSVRLEIVILLFHIAQPRSVANGKGRETRCIREHVMAEAVAAGTSARLIQARVSQQHLYEMRCTHGMNITSHAIGIHMRRMAACENSFSCTMRETYVMWRAPPKNRRAAFAPCNIQSRRRRIKKDLYICTCAAGGKSRIWAGGPRKIQMSISKSNGFAYKRFI